jgi:hypothetical protein
VPDCATMIILEIYGRTDPADRYVRVVKRRVRNGSKAEQDRRCDA